MGSLVPADGVLHLAAEEDGRDRGGAGAQVNAHSIPASGAGQCCLFLAHDVDGGYSEVFECHLPQLGEVCAGWRCQQQGVAGVVQVYVDRTEGSFPQCLHVVPFSDHTVPERRGLLQVAFLEIVSCARARARGRGVRWP